ncbi:MAG: CCA tRNA nucleotidyltransferase [Candidatus Hydrogenedentota bacterium]
MTGAARYLCTRLKEAGHEVLFAGGYVRDCLLGLPSKDIDIATSATPEEVEKLFPKSIPVGAAFGVLIVVHEGFHFEVATFRDDGNYADGRRPTNVTFVDAEQDALRRDFTVNALFQDPFTDEIIDYVNGEADLKAGIIRAVGDPHLRFGEDHLRLLRAVRFAAQLDFTVEAETLNGIRSHAKSLARISPERIRNELERILTQPRSSSAIRQMLDTGLLEVVLPELVQTVGCEQPPEFHPEGDVFTHTMLLLDHLDCPTFTLAMGALLHDIGKPATQTFEDRIRFNHHEKEGTEMADVICQRLRLSNEEREEITWLVSQHMRISAMPDMKESKRKRLVRETGFEKLLDLMRVDCLASHGDMSTYEWITVYSDNLEPDAIRPDALVTGDDLITLGYRPGPLFKEILQRIEDAQLEDTLSNKEEALAFISTQWPTDSTD